MKKQKNIVIIPARGGSKRLPKKNIMLLNKLPLIVHSINYAKQNLAIVDKIVVSTDNKEIKKIALKFGAEVIDRPEVISGDLEPTVTALKNVLESLKEEFDNVILLQPTNPLRPENLLSKAYEKYIEEGYDSLITVSRNLEKLGKINNNKFVPFNYKIGQRSQDLEPLYSENGLLYISKSSLILKEKIVGEKCFPLITNHSFSKVDIDTIEDFNYAKFMIENYSE